MRSEIHELAKVTAIGAAGWWTTVKLADVATLVSIAVGLLTFTYIAVKLYYLIKHDGRNSGS